MSARGDPENTRAEHGGDVGLDADLQEEDRNEECRHGRNVARNALVRRRLAQCRTGNECSDDRREFRGIGNTRVGERDTDGNDRYRRRRRRLLCDVSDQSGHGREADRGGDREE